MINLKIGYGFQHVPEVTAFDLWPLDLVKNNIPVLHSLSSEWWQNFTWNFNIPFKNVFKKYDAISSEILPCFRIEAVEMLLLTKSKGHKSNAVTLETRWKPQKILDSSELTQILVYFIELCPGWPCTISFQRT